MSADEPSSNKAKPTRAPKPKASIPRRIARWMLRIVVALVGLVALGLVVLHTRPVKERLRHRIEERLGQRVYGSAELAELDYLLGFGDIRLRGLKLKDERGDAPISIGELRIAPNWGKILRGEIVVDAIELRKVDVQIVQDADGSSNLKRLFKPRDPITMPNKVIAIRSLAIEDVAVAIQQPDGGKVALTDLDIAADISIQPAEKTGRIRLSDIHVELGLDKGESKLRLGVRDLHTGVTVDLDHGKGKVKLDPIKAGIALRLPGRDEKTFPFELTGVAVDLDEGQIGGTLEGLAASALALATAEVHVRTEGGNLKGDQRADVIGWKIDRKKLHELLGKEILATDIATEVHLSGPMDKLNVDAQVKTDGGHIGLTGVATVDLVPSYDMKLVIDDIDTEKLLIPGATAAPPATLRHLELTAKGKGATKETVEVDTELHAQDIVLRAIPIHHATVKARVDKGVATVKELEIVALGQTVRANGRYVLASKKVNLGVDVFGDPSEALDGLRAAGRPIATKLPKRAVRIPEGGLHVDVDGVADGDLQVVARGTRIAALGGSVGIDAKALLHREPPSEDPAAKKITVKALIASVDVDGVRISQVAAIRGRELAVDGAVSAHIRAEGPPEKIAATFELGVDDVAYKGFTLPDLKLRARGRGSRSGVDARLDLTGKDRASLLELTAHVPLTEVEGKPKLATNAPFSLHVEAPDRRMKDTVMLATGAGSFEAKTPEGSAHVLIDLEGTLAKPEGVIEIDADPKVLPAAQSKVVVRGKVSTESGRPTLALTADAWLDGARGRTLHAAVDASVARSPVVPGPRDPKFAANVELGPIDLATLPDLPPDRLPKERLDRIRAIGGLIEAKIALRGDEKDLRGTVDLTGRKVGGPGRPVPAEVDLAAHVDIGDADTKVDVGVDLAGSRLLAVKGTAGLAGKGLIAQLREKKKPDPTLDFDIDVPERPLASLSVVRPGLASAPGRLGGHFDVGGRASLPTASGALGVTGVAAADGSPTGAEVRLSADEKLIAAVIGLGSRGGSDPSPVKIEAKVDRAELKALSETEGREAPVTVSFTAAKVPLTRLVPALASTDKGVQPKGELDVDLSLKAALRKPEGPTGASKLEDPKLEGHLDIRDGTVGLPGAKRAFHDVALAIAAKDGTVRIDRLHAEESDLEKKKRTLDVSGKVALDGLKPRSADLKIGAKDWLLFGKSLGKADAPRGALTLDADVDADLSNKIRKIEVDVRTLQALIPDRLEKGHQPEDLHLGDVYVVGEPGVQVGKLPVPESVAEKARLAAAPPAPPVVDDGTGTDIKIRVHPGARILQSPIDLSPRGELSVRIRPSGREIRGQLVMDKGELSLGGKMHELEKGSFTFDEKHPTGDMDLWFAKKLAPHQLRDISERSATDSIRIHMSGPISDRKTVLSGAGSPGALFDLLAMHNSGHPRFATEPDMPDTGSVEFQSLDSILILSFLSVNLPHLLFLDRAGAWSDPYDDMRTYGRVNHYDAEKTSGAVRVRGKARPQTLGASEAEVGLDVLFVDTPTFDAGTGVVGGSRGGGGPELFLEWSSQD